VKSGLAVSIVFLKSEESGKGPQGGKEKETAVEFRKTAVLVRERARGAGVRRSEKKNVETGVCKGSD